MLTAVLLFPNPQVAPQIDPPRRSLGYGPDDRVVDPLGRERSFEPDRLGGRDQESSGGLSIGQDELLGGRAVAPVGGRLKPSVVALGASGHDVATSQVERSVQERNG